MARSTLSDAKASRIPATLNLDSSDSRFLAYLNEAQNALLIRMKPWGCYQRVHFCVTDSCIVLPRQIASIDSVWVNDRPIPIRNQWFEYLDSGFGLQGTDTSISNQNAGLQWIDRGTTCVYSEVVATGKKLRVYADVEEAAGSKILLQGYDDNDNWIRTLVGGNYIDGEYVSLEATPNLTANNFSVISSVQKPVTNGFVRLYEYNTADATQRQIGLYEPDETRPDYRKVFLDNLDAVAADADGNKHVTVQVKLDFIPARSDNDFLLISNLTALKYGCQAIQKAERNLWQESEAYMMKAIAELQHELRHYEGVAQVVPVRFQNPSLFGASGLNIL